MSPELPVADADAASISRYFVEHQLCNKGRSAAGSVGRKPHGCYGNLNQRDELGAPARQWDAPRRPQGTPDRIWNRTANAEAGNHVVGRLKTWKVDFIHAPSRKLLPGLAAPLTEHVQAALRMLCRAPLRFLLGDPRCLLAQPELSVAEPSFLSCRGLVVVSKPARPSFPSSAPRLGCASPETAVMSARLPALSQPRWPGPLLLVLLLLEAAPGPRPGAAFYLPGLAPVNFCEEEKKSDECKVGEAWRTLSALTEGEPSFTRGAEVREEGGVAGIGLVSREVLGFGPAVSRRFWNGL